MKHLSWDEAWDLAERLPRVGEMDNTVLQHVQGCTPCRHLVEQAEVLIEALRDEAKLPRRVQENVDDDKLWQAIAERIDQGRDVAGHTQRRPKGRRGYRVYRASSWSAVVAAIMVGAVGFGWYRLHDHGPKRAASYALLQSAPTASTASTIRKDTASASPVSGGATTNAGSNIASSGVAGMTKLNQPSKTQSVFFSSMATPTVRGTVRIHVVGQVGCRSEPSAHAHVALLSRAGVVWSGLTGADGSVVTSQVDVPSPQWLSVHSGVQAKVSGEATVVVWKAGYGSYVEAGVPVFGNGMTSTVQVRLSKSNDSDHVTGWVAPLPRTDVMALGSSWLAGTSKGPLSAEAHQPLMNVHVTSPKGVVVQNADVSWLSANGLGTDRTNSAGLAHIAVPAMAQTALSPACIPSSVWIAAGKPLEGVFHVGSSLGTGVWVGFVNPSQDINLAIPRQSRVAPFELSESLPMPESMIDLVWKYVQKNVR